VWREDIVEFVEEGHVVSQFETDERVILEGCKDDCPNKPHPEVKEIRPKDIEELWLKDGLSYATVIDRGSAELQFICCNDSYIWSLDNLNISPVIHNKNGWKRVFPKPEDDSIEI
jgi:hypothetical protein